MDIDDFDFGSLYFCVPKKEKK